MSRTFLYRRSGPAVIVIVILAFLAAVSLPGSAQMPQLKRPQDDTPEKLPEDKKPRKKIKGPRAVGLLQMNSSGKGSLIPIAILVDGKFYDASEYKAEPVPMALEVGTVYEVEQTGDSQGLFTVNGAMHTKATGSAHPWTATGSFLPQGTEVAKTTRKAENVPVGLNSGDNDAPPRLTRGTKSKPADSGSTAPPADKAAGTGSSDKPAANPPPATPPANGTAADKSTGSTSSGNPSSGNPSSGQDTAKPAASPPSEKPPDKPANQDSKGDAPKAQPTTAGNAPTSPSAPNQTSTNPAPPAQGADGKKPEEYYRPTLRRGKPTEPAPKDDELTAKPAPATSSAAAATSPSTGALQFVPAISDGGGPDPRSYKFFWKTGEEDERRSQMLELAATELRAYTTALVKNSIPAQPAPRKAAPTKSVVSGHKTAKPVPPVFENTQFHAFDLWGNNQAVMVLSTEAHFAPAPGSDKAPETYSITLATRTDIYGNLRKIYSGVTDRFHLDVTPKLEIIDAVDADGDGRGELLFRETTDAGPGFVIYRATGDKLFKLFDSVNGE